MLAAAGQNVEHFGQIAADLGLGRRCLRELIVAQRFAGRAHPADGSLLPGQVERVGQSGAGRGIFLLQFAAGLIHGRKQLVELTPQFSLPAGQLFQIGLLLGLEIAPLLAQQAGAKLFGRSLQFGLVAGQLRQIVREAAIAVPLPQLAQHLLERLDHSLLMHVDFSQRGRHGLALVKIGPARGCRFGQIGLRPFDGKSQTMFGRGQMLGLQPLESREHFLQALAGPRQGRSRCWPDR